MKVWYEPANNAYHILCNGLYYKRLSYCEAKALIDALDQNERLLDVVEAV